MVFGSWVSGEIGSVPVTEADASRGADDPRPDGRARPAGARSRRACRSGPRRSPCSTSASRAATCSSTSSRGCSRPRPPVQRDGQADLHEARAGRRARARSPSAATRSSRRSPTEAPVCRAVCATCSSFETAGCPAVLVASFGIAEAADVQPGASASRRSGACSSPDPRAGPHPTVSRRRAGRGRRDRRVPRRGPPRARQREAHARAELGVGEPDPRRRAPRRSRARSRGRGRRRRRCAPRRRRRGRTVEDARALLGGDAVAGVGDLDLDAAVVALGAHGDAAVGGRVADRVLDQVEEHALQLLGVGGAAASVAGDARRARDGAGSACGRIASTVSLDELVELDAARIDQRMSPASSRAARTGRRSSALSGADVGASSAPVARRASSASTTPSSTASTSSRSAVSGVRRSCETAATSSRRALGRRVASAPRRRDHRVRRGGELRRARRAPPARRHVAPPSPTAREPSRTALEVGQRARREQPGARPDERARRRPAAPRSSASWRETNIVADEQRDAATHELRRRRARRRARTGAAARRPRAGARAWAPASAATRRAARGSRASAARAPSSRDARRERRRDRRRRARAQRRALTAANR